MIHNHKESPEIIAEMEEATRVPTQTLMALRPGLDDTREKLRLASTRETTRVEDAAYSLLGIFAVSLPVAYGEGDQALGRLLAQLLASSGDTSILAWTGRSGSFNSCLPESIVVFGKLPTTHIPPAATRIEIGGTDASGSRLASLNMKLVTELYEQLNGLSVPSFSGKRMRLPCIYFKLGPVSVSRHGSEYIFRSQTAALGIVGIRTEEDLSRFGSLRLVHPWIDFLLDRQPVGSIMEMIAEESIDSSLINESPSLGAASNTIPRASQGRATQLVSRLGRPFGGRRATSGHDMTSLRPPSTVSPMEKQMRTLDLIARLRRPFGALLLTPTRKNMDEFRRIAAESLITVQVQETTPEVLKKLIESARILDVL